MTWFGPGCHCKGLSQETEEMWHACPKIIGYIDSVRKKTLDRFLLPTSLNTPASVQSVGFQKVRTAVLVPCLEWCLTPLWVT